MAKPKPTAKAPIYRLKIILRDTKPPIWRSIEVVNGTVFVCWLDPRRTGLFHFHRSHYPVGVMARIERQESETVEFKERWADSALES